MRLPRFTWYLITLLFFLHPFLARAATPLRLQKRNSPWYLSLAGGVNNVSDMEISSSTKIQYQDGYFLSMAGGADIRFFRLELEGTLSENNVHQVTLYGNAVSSSGDVSMAALMFNGYLVWHNATRFCPYFGLGVGAARLAFNDIHDQNGQLTLDDTEVGSAVQIILGVDYRLNNRLDTGIRIRGQDFGPIKFTNQSTGESHEEYYDSIAGTIALRYRF